MMELLTLVSPILVTLAVFIISYLPGRIVLDRFSFLETEEKFGFSFLTTFILFYPFCFIAYCLSGNPEFSYRIILAIGALGILLSCRRILVILSNKRERIFLLQGLCMLFWLFIFQSLHRFYGGGGWSGDWYEHFERSVYFSLRYSRYYQFIAIYLLPARPPLFNLTGSLFMSLFGFHFWVFQIAASCMNMTMVFAAWLLIRSLCKKRAPVSLLAMIALFMLNVPMVRQMIYTMTKGLAAAYVLAGVFLYLKGRMVFDKRYFILAFLFLSAGVLTHYSVIPFFLAVCADFFLLSFIRPSRLKISLFAVVAFLSFAFMLGWFAYSVSIYGWHDTFLSNTSYSDSMNLSMVQRLSKDIYNLRTTLIPNLINMKAISENPMPKKVFLLYDLFISVYCESITGNLGLTFFLIFLVILFRNFRSRILPEIKTIFSSPTFVFWVLFIGFGGALAIASNGAPMRCGTAHVSFVPLSALFLSLVFVIIRDASGKTLGIVAGLGVLLESLFLLSLRLVVLSGLFFSLPVVRRSTSDFSNYVIREHFQLEFLEGLYSRYSFFLLMLFFAGWIIWAWIFLKNMNAGFSQYKESRLDKY